MATITLIDGTVRMFENSTGIIAKRDGVVIVCFDDGNDVYPAGYVVDFTYNCYGH